MSDLHIWTGLLAGWLLYAIFLTGSASYFRAEISSWARPGLPAVSQATDDLAQTAQRLVDAMAAEHAPTAERWGIFLPTGREHPARAFWTDGRMLHRAELDPGTGRKLALPDTQGGEFFYRFHYNLHYLPNLLARCIVGFCAMFMLVAIISGIITHKKIFADFFTFRWGKGQRAWLDAHNGLSVLGLPFHLMITYTGLVTLMLTYMPWGMMASFERPQDQARFLAEVSVWHQPEAADATRAPLAPVSRMVRTAQARWGSHGVDRILVNNPGRANARVVVARADSGRVSESPRVMVFDGSNGRLLETRDPLAPVAETRGVLLALHTGRYADPWLRGLYLLLGLAGAAMVATGLVLWTVKRRSRLPDPSRPHLGFRLVERLNIASIAGLPVAMAAFLWGTRLLPASLPARSDLEVDLFFAVWALMALHAILRPPRRAWVEQLSLGSALLALLPSVNALTSERGLHHSLPAGDWVFAGFDIGMLLLASLLASCALRTARHHSALPAARKARTASGSSRPAGSTTGRAAAPAHPGNGASKRSLDRSGHLDKPGHQNLIQASGRQP